MYVCFCWHAWSACFFSCFDLIPSLSCGITPKIYSLDFQFTNEIHWSFGSLVSIWNEPCSVLPNLSNLPSYTTSDHCANLSIFISLWKYFIRHNTYLHLLGFCNVLQNMCSVSLDNKKNYVCNDVVSSNSFPHSLKTLIECCFVLKHILNTQIRQSFKIHLG